MEYRMFLDCREAAGFVEGYSETLVIEHLGYTPSTWCVGGQEHNDDRLSAEVVDAENGAGIWVKDSVVQEFVECPVSAPELKVFVDEWMDELLNKE